MTDETEPRGSLAALVRNEPLAVFLLLGAVLYGCWRFFAPVSGEVVRIEPEAIRAAERQQVELLGRALTDTERATIREDFIDQEVLLREALRRGLHWGDYRVRQRLVRMMRGVLTESVPDPSVA